MIKNELLNKKKGLIASVLVAIIILLIPTPGPVEFAHQTINLTYQGQAVLALLAALIIIFITEALPIGASVGIVYAWTIFFGILDKRVAETIFSKDAAWFLVGALMMATVLIKYNLHKRALIWILKLTGTKTRNIVFGLVAFCAISAAFVAEHLIAAMMLPIVLAIIVTEGGFKKNPNLTRLLLFSICFGAAIGGIGTPSGGGRNVIMIGLIEQFAGVSIGYGAWMLMAMPITIILIPILSFILLKRWKPEIEYLENSTLKIRKEMKMSKMGVSEWGTVIIFLFILYLWMFHSNLGIGMIALLGATLFLIFGLAEWKDYQKINWNIPMLYFGAVGLGTVLQTSGAAKWLAAKILVLVGNIISLSGFSLIAFQTTAMSLFTQVMADGPAAATIGPVLIEATSLTGGDPVVTGVAIAIACAFAFLFIIGTPSNAIIYGSGYVKPKDFLTTGIFIEVIALILLWLIIQFWWGFLGVGVNGFH